VAPCAVPMRLARIGQHIKDESCAKQRALLGVFCSRYSSVSRGSRGEWRPSGSPHIPPTLKAQNMQVVECRKLSTIYVFLYPIRYMAEPQPETPLSNNMYTALDIVGQTQLAHVGGYRDESRLGVAMGNSGDGGLDHVGQEHIRLYEKRTSYYVIFLLYNYTLVYILCTIMYRSTRTLARSRAPHTFTYTHHFGYDMACSPPQKGTSYMVQLRLPISYFTRTGVLLYCSV
jgi:hypothetical protein